jgi:hypothetical protein
MWFDIAAAGGHEDAAAVREKLAAKMTPEQVSHAESLARKQLSQ